MTQPPQNIPAAQAVSEIPPGPPPVAPPSTWQRLWRAPLFQLLVYVLVAWVVWRFFEHLRPLIISVLVAYLIAHLTHPLLVLMEKRGTPRPLGITMLVIGLLAIIAGVIPLITAVASEIQSLVQQAPQLIENVSGTLKGLAERYPALAHAQTQFDAWVRTNTADLPKRLSEVLTSLLSPKGALVSGVVGAVGWVGRLFITLIISIYMMAIYPAIGPFLLRLLPERFQPQALDVSHHVSRAVGGYFRGQITVALIMGVIIGLGLTVLGVPSALAIGFLAAILNVVPYLGVILSIIPALLLALPLGWLKVVLVLGLFIGANQIEGHFIAPRVMAQSTHLSSLAVLLAILFGVELFGLMGAVIAVPAVAAIKSLLDAYYYTSRPYRAVANPQDAPPNDGGQA